jgi:hypothetical protein
LVDKNDVRDDLLRVVLRTDGRRLPFLIYGVAKSVWDLLLEAASGISGQPDDTAAAVATWSFLHGYAVLEHSGAFGASGPKGALERGLTAFLTSFPVKEHAR